MKKKKWLFLSIFIVFLVFSIFFVVHRNNEKSSEEKRINSIKKELINHSKSESFSCVNIDANLRNNVVYVFDFSSNCGDINNLQVVIISKEDKDFILTYGFYQKSDVLVEEKINNEDVTKLRLLTSSSFDISEFYIYLSYNGTKEYLKVSLGD